MKEPSLLRFVAPKKPTWFRYRLRTLLLLMAFVGPFVLVASALPPEFYILQGSLVLVVVLPMGLAWCVSFVRPRPLAICFLALILFSAGLGISLFAGSGNLRGFFFAATGASSLAALVTGLAFGLSWSRYAR